METIKIDGLEIEKSEFEGVPEARIVVSKHMVLHTKISEMSIYWYEEDELFKLITGIKGTELYLDKDVAEKIAEFLDLTKWAYDDYDNVVIYNDNEWTYTEI